MAGLCQIYFGSMLSCASFTGKSVFRALRSFDYPEVLDFDFKHVEFLVVFT